MEDALQVTRVDWPVGSTFAEMFSGWDVVGREKRGWSIPLHYAGHECVDRLVVALDPSAKKPYLTMVQWSDHANDPAWRTPCAWNH